MQAFEALGQVESGKGKLTADDPAAVATRRRQHPQRALTANRVTSTTATLACTRTSSAPTVALSGLLASVRHTASVVTLDAAGNRWSTSTDNIGVTGCEITVGTATLNNVGTSLQVTGLVAGMSRFGLGIGNRTPGSSGFSNGVFTTSASGSDIWSTVDSFRFVRQSTTDDGQVTARVTALDVTDAWAKAGVAMRATLASNSPHALMAVTGSHGAAFQSRATAGGATSRTPGPAVPAACRVRMVRQGNLLTAYTSADGSVWALVASQSIFMPGTLFIGLAHTSHRNGVLGNASHANVVLAGATARHPIVRCIKLDALSEVNGGPWTSMAEFKLLDENGVLISRAGGVASADSQASGYPMSSAVDGNTLTLRHTPWSPTSLPMPHNLVVDPGTARQVGGFKLLPRQDGGNNGKLANRRFHTTTGGVTWAQVAHGAFTASAAEQTVMIPR